MVVLSVLSQQVGVPSFVELAEFSNVCKSDIFSRLVLLLVFLVQAKIVGVELPGCRQLKHVGAALRFISICHLSSGVLFKADGHLIVS